MRSHSVTCHPAEVTFPPLPQPKLVLDLATPEGCKAELTSCMRFVTQTPEELWPIVLFTLNTDTYGISLQASLRGLLRHLPSAVAVDSAWLTRARDQHISQMESYIQSHTTTSRRHRYGSYRHRDDNYY